MSFDKSYTTSHNLNFQYVWWFVLCDTLSFVSVVFCFVFCVLLIFFFLNSSFLLDDDGWGDEEGLEAPKYLFAAVVIKEYIPPTHTHLTLELDNLVYVFKTVLISFFSLSLLFLLSFSFTNRKCQATLGFGKESTKGCWVSSPKNM